MKQIKFSIVTPEKTVLEKTVDSVSVMTSTGEITILPNHSPLVSELMPGEARITVGKNEELLAISTGFVEVRDGGEVVILADTADRAEDLNIEAIKKAQDEARKVMEAKETVSNEEYARAAVALQREMARLKVAIKRKR